MLPDILYDPNTIKGHSIGLQNSPSGGAPDTKKVKNTSVSPTTLKAKSADLSFTVVTPPSEKRTSSGTMVRKMKQTPDDIIMDSIMTAKDHESLSRENVSPLSLRRIKSKYMKNLRENEVKKLFKKMTLQEKTDCLRRVVKKDEGTSQLIALFKSPILSKTLREVLEKAYIQENYYFLQACFDWTQLSNTEEKLKKARYIAEQFLATGAEQQINIEDVPTQHKRLTSLIDKRSVDKVKEVLDDLVEQILRLVKDNFPEKSESSI